MTSNITTTKPHLGKSQLVNAISHLMNGRTMKNFHLAPRVPLNEDKGLVNLGRRDASV